MSEALLAIQNILQNSNIFDRSRETVLFTPFGDKKVTQFSGFRPTSVGYFNQQIKFSFALVCGYISLFALYPFLETFMNSCHKYGITWRYEFNHTISCCDIW